MTSPARLVETLAFKVVALVIAATVAILLWQFALRVTGYAASVVGRDTVTATVVEYDRSFGVHGPCVVKFVDDEGHSRRADLSSAPASSRSPPATRCRSSPRTTAPRP